MASDTPPDPYETTPPTPPPGGYGASGFPPPTNALAIAALVCAIGGVVIGISAPVGAVLGHVARRQLRERGERGDGLALAAIIIGWIITGLLLLACCVAGIAIAAATD